VILLAEASYTSKIKYNIDDLMSSLVACKTQAEQVDGVLANIGKRGNLNNFIKQFVAMDDAVKALRKELDSVKAGLGDKLNNGWMKSFDEMVEKMSQISELSKNVFAGLNSVNLKDKGATKELRSYAEQLNTILNNVGIDKQIDLELFDKKDIEAQYNELIQFAGELNGKLSVVFGEIDPSKLGESIKSAGGKVKDDIKTTGSGISAEVQAQIDELKKQKAAYQEILDIFNGKGKRLRTTQDNDKIALVGLFKDFKKAEEELAELERTGKPGKEEALAKKIKAASLLKNTSDYVADKGSDDASAYVANNVKIYERAEEFLKEIRTKQNAELDKIKSDCRQKIKEIKTEIAQLGKGVPETKADIFHVQPSGAEAGVKAAQEAADAAKKKADEEERAYQAITKSIEAQRVMYHLGTGSAINGKGAHSDTFADMLDNLTINANGTRYEKYGFGLLGSGIFGVQNPNTIPKDQASSAGKFIYSLDLSKYNMYLLDTEERAANLMDFMSKLQKIAIRGAVPNYTGFNEFLGDTDINSLYEQFATLFDKTKFTKEQLGSFIDEMVAQLTQAGLFFDSESGQLDFRNISDELANSDNISTRFFKKLGYQGVNVGNTSLDGFGQGSVLFDFNESDIVGYFNTIEQAAQDFQNNLKSGWVGSNEQLQQYLANIEEIIAKINTAKQNKLQLVPDFDTSGYDNTLTLLNNVKTNISNILSGTAGTGDSNFATVTDNQTAQLEKEKELMQEIATLKEKLSAVSTNPIDASELETAKKQIQELDEEILRMEGALDSWKSSYYDAQHALDMSVDASQLENMTSNDIVDAYKAQIESLSSTVDELKTKLAEAKEQLSGFGQDADLYSADNSQLSFWPMTDEEIAAKEKLVAANEQVAESQNKINQAKQLEGQISFDDLSMVEEKQKGVDAAEQELATEQKQNEAIQQQLELQQQITKEKQNQKNVTKESVTPASSQEATSEISGGQAAEGAIAIPSETDAVNKAKEAFATAAEQKQKFIDANVKVKESAEASATAIDKEAQKAQGASEAFSSATDKKNNFVSANKSVKNSTDEKTSSGTRKSSDSDSAYKDSDTYKTLIDANKKLSSAFNKIDTEVFVDKNTELGKLKTRYEELTKEIQELTKSEETLGKVSEEDMQRLSAATKQLMSDFEKYAQAKKEASKQKDSTYGADVLEKVQSQHTSLIDKVDSGGYSNASGIANKLQQYEQAYQRIIDLQKKLANTDITSDLGKKTAAEFDDAVKSFNNYGKKIENIIKKSESIQDKIGNIHRAVSEGFDFGDEASRRSELEAFARSFDGLDEKSIQFSDSYSKVVFTIKNGNGEIEKITASFNQAGTAIDASSKNLGKAVNKFTSFFDGIKKKAGEIVTYFTGANLVYKSVAQIRQGITYVKEIDAALTELKKVTDETDKTYANFLKTASQTGSEIGSTIADFTNATADFARLGYTISEATELAKAASIYKNVGDGIESVSQATESIISTMKAFGIEAKDSMSIVDKFNEVGNRFAISSTGIGEALQRSASALYESGNTIDESIALITAANSVIQNPEQVGTALKTLSLRLRGAKVELQEAGEDTDNMAESVSSLQEKLLALTHGKVDIMADATTFKNTTEILREMSSAWSDMTDIERAAALELMGGKRQANILASIIKNYDTVDDVIETSLDSQNSAYEENAKWMDSIEGKMTEFKNAVQSLWQDVLGSNAIKDVISLGTGLVNIVDTIGAIPTILGGIAVYFFAIKKNNPITMFKDLANTIQNFSTAASNVQTLSKVGMVFDSNSVNLYAAAVSNLSAKQQALALSSAGLTKQQVAEVLAKNGCSEATIEQAVAEANLATAKTTTNTITGEQLFNLAAEKDIKLSEQAVTWLAANAEAELTREKILAAVASGELAEADGEALIAMSGLSAGVKGLGASLKALFLSNPVGLALMAVTAITAIVSAVKRAKEEAKQAAQETLDAYKDAQNTLKSNKNTINEISSDYERLSKGVDDFGNNISLTTDEYKKYNEITNKIADMFPEMISGYTKEGTAILSCKGNVDELTKAYEAAAQAARQAAIAGGSDVFDSAKEEYNSNPSVSWEETGLKQKQKLANKLVELANQGTEEEIQKFFNDLNAGNIEIDGEKYSNIELDALFKEAGIDISDFRSWWDNSIDVDKFKEKMRLLESFIKTSVTKINTETSKVRSILSAYLGEDEDYAKLDDETKSIINNIVSQLDPEFVFSFDNIDSLYNWVSENIVQAFSGNNGKVQNAIKDFLKIDTSSLSVTDYKKEIENFKKVLSDAGISEEAQKQILSAFKIDDDYIKTEIDPLVNHTKSILKDEFDDKVDSLTISDLQIVDSLDIPDGTLLTWDELLERINAVKSEMRTPVVQTYDTIKGSIENFNDVQKQTEDIMLDNTEVTQEYKDSLVALGISETDLASCFDKNNQLVVKNVSRLKQLVNASKTNISTQTILARAQARLKYKELYKQLATLTNGQLNSAQANREKINTLYQEMSAIQKVISRYSLLEQQLSEVTKTYSEFEEAQSFDSANDYMSKTEDMLTAAIKAYETGDLGTETAQVAIKALTPDVEFEGLDTVDEKAEKAHEYLTETLNKYFTIELDDNGAIQSAEMKLGNLRKFIEDAFSNNVFSGEDWQHFEWSDEFLSGLEDAPDKLQYFADEMNVTKEVALSAIQEIKNKDAEWLNGDYGSLFDQIVPETLDAKLQDTTAKLAELNVQLANGKVSQEEYETAIKQLNTQLVEQQNAASDACQSFIDVNGKIDESQQKLEAYQKQLSTGTDTNGNQLTSGQIEEINGKYNQELQNYEGYLKQKTELENKYGPMTEYTVSVALEQNGINVDEINTELTNVKQNIQEAFNSDNFKGANKALEDTYGVIAKINENGDIEYSVTDNTSDDQKKTLEELGALNDDGTVNIDCLYAGLTDEQKAEVDKLETLQEKKNLIDYYLSMDGVDTVQSSIDELATTLTDIYELLQTSPMFKANVDQDTKTTLDELLDQVNSWVGDHWASFKAKVSSIFGGNSGDQESNGTANVSGTAHATGSWGLEQSEHNALVGELGMETVVDPNTGRYYTVGDHGAELVDLPKNAIIFNHKQTDALFRNGYINSRGKALANGNAHIDGNAHVTIYPNYTLPSQWEGTGYRSYDDGMYNASNALQDAAGDISDAADDAKQTIDFIEYRLDEIENIITNATNRLENFLDDTSQTREKNSLYEDLVNAEKQKASTYFSAAATYNKKAAQLLSEVPAEYQEMAKNGAIAIKDFIGENEGEIADAIEEYRTWSSKAEDAENNYLASIAEISAKRLEQLQDIADDFENIVGLTEQHSNLIQAEMDLLDEAGERLSENFYNELMKDSKKQIEDLNNKRASLQDILDNAVKSGDVQVGSDDWYEMVNAIFDVDDAILECKKDIEGFQNSINDLYWDNLDKLIDRIDNVDSELSHLYNLVSDEEKIVDDAGNWTKDGVTALGLLAQQLEVANFKVEQYGEAIARLKKDYAAGLYSTDEYNEKLAELKENQWGAIEAQESAKKSLIDLNKTRIQAVKDGMQKEIDAYSKLIDRKKEELNFQKESHDFSKQVAEQQKNIADIEKRLAVISGDNSASAIAQKKKLQAELAQAKEELEELYYDHSVEKQQDALDKQLEDYQNNKQNEMDALDESLKNEDQIIQDSYTTIAANTELLAQNLSDIADKYGITLSDSVTKPWLDGADAIGTYQGQLDTSMSAFTEQLKLLKQELIDLQVEADKTANSIINATNSKKDKTESARYTPPTPAQQPSPSPAPAPEIPEPPSKGSSVTVKSSATHFSRNGGNGTRMQSWVPGSTFTVYQVSGDEVLLGRNGGYTGWVKLSDIEGYAKGSKAIHKDQFAFLDELGEELQLVPDGAGRLSYVKKGTGIIPADLTERLMEWGQLDPSNVLEQSKPTVSAPHVINNNIELNLQVGEVVHIDHADNSSIPNIAKAVQDQMDNYMKNVNKKLYNRVR
jgi:TP901 family phage tail tape measure protein